ncbi:MAG: cytochrome c3 family protein [Pseudomonadota bacterium]
MNMGARLSAAAPLLLLIALCCAAGCDKYTRYRTLNFFFDGVPHPDAQARAEQEALLKSGSGPLAKIKYKHPASGKADECSICHGSRFNVGSLPRDMCLQCHTAIKKNRSFIHGPAAIDCIACHDIHESETKTLLRKTGNTLCFQCHYRIDKGLITKIEAHKDFKEDASQCLSCHDPHGGSDRFFIKNKNA